MTKLNFGQDALVLPGSVLNRCADAGAEEYRVLLWLASDLSLADKPKQLAKLADTDTDGVARALEFWRQAGVLTSGEAIPAMAPAPDAPAKKKRGGESAAPEKRVLLRRADELPNYTSTELADLMEKRAGVRALIDEAQRIIGKMFNPSEINIMVGMLDYLGMSGECILLLLAHCKRIGKTNLRAVEKYAYSLTDEGITDEAALEEKIRTVEALATFEGEVRTLFGMKSRALTGKESKMLAAWMSYGYGIDVVRIAYDMTVNATNEPSVPYANAILERWHAEGLTNADEIYASTEKEKAPAALGNSFDTDEFFEAALRRSYAEEKKEK